ncbi:MAG: YbaK/EbsC family protein [Acidothermus sp.]|nr:YbaK/EbsC family protein [Acidothermus sp.]MCL6537615.1 YbaK/EbsC family protein [Acidothermus sp.]
MSSLPPSVIRVRDALRAAGVEPEIRFLAESARTAAQAAAALGVEIGQIANSLIFQADGAPLLVLASGRHRVDTRKVAQLMGVADVRRADPEFVREHAGVAIGGVAPVGHPRPLRTAVDLTLADYETIWAAAGHPHAVFPTTFAELVRITNGIVGVIGSEDGNTR